MILQVASQKQTQFALENKQDPQGHLIFQPIDFQGLIMLLLFQGG